MEKPSKYYRDQCCGLATLDETTRLKRAREIVDELGPQFNADVCALLVGALEETAEFVQKNWFATLPKTPNSAWLRAHFLSDNAELASAWEDFFSFRVERDPFDLLAWSRALAAAGDHEQAVRQMRLALSQGVGHAFFVRAESLVQKLAAPRHSNLRRCKIAVLGSSTTSFLVPVLRALCLRDGINAEFYEAPYGSIGQEIWSEKSGLADFRPGIVLFAMNWRDLGLEAVTKDEQAWISQFVGERKHQWTRLTDQFACQIIQPLFDYPAHEPYGRLASVLPGGRTRLIDVLNLRMREAALPNVSILDVAAVQRDIGNRRWQDDLAWVRYRQHPSLEALPDLAESHMAIVRAVLGISRKVLVADLDNTLWGGIIGEDGLDGIKIGPDSHEGEAYLALQRYLLELQRRGILLAVCSKNNPEDAQLPFLYHPHMALKLEDFAAFRANWNDKVTNLRAIAGELSLGLDSFVFLDDNPVECEWVRSQLPEVTVVGVTNPPLSALRRLDRGRYFEALSLSSEDLARAGQYRVEAQRKSLFSVSASLEGFLERLRMEAVAEEVTAKNLARVTQLINKTNQFNLTTRRYTEAQVRQVAEDSDCWIRAFRLADRMGSYGLIGVLICRPANQLDTWEIDTWLMSCRVLGREMEKFMLDRLIEAASERGARQIEGVYLPTAKNALVKDLYDRLGFQPIDRNTSEVRYVLTAPATPVTTASHIRNMAHPATPTSDRPAPCVA
jgi:FkbH-like protein